MIIGLIRILMTMAARRLRWALICWVTWKSSHACALKRGRLHGALGSFNQLGNHLSACGVSFGVWLNLGRGRRAWEVWCIRLGWPLRAHGRTT